MGKITLTILTSFSILLAYSMIFGIVTATVEGATTNTESRSRMLQRQNIVGNSGSGGGGGGGGSAGVAQIQSPFQIRRLRSPYGKMASLQNGRQHGAFLENGDFVVDDDDILLDMSKKFDDYGHMRFGKRGGDGDQFDDYGHMRFGRSLEV